MTSPDPEFFMKELARMDDFHSWAAALRQSLQGLTPSPGVWDERMGRGFQSFPEPMSSFDDLDEWLEGIGSDMFELAAYRLAATGSDSDFKAFLAEQKPLNVPLMECALGDQPEAHEKLKAFRVAAGYSDCDWDSFIDCLEHLNR